MRDIQRRPVFQIIGAYRGNRSGEVYFLLRTVTYDDSFRKHRGIVRQENLHIAFACTDNDILRVITEAGNFHAYIFAWKGERELAVFIGCGSCTFSCKDCSSDNRLIVGIQHCSGNGSCGGGSLDGFRNSRNVDNAALHLDCNRDWSKDFGYCRFYCLVRNAYGNLLGKVQTVGFHDE